MCYLLYQYLQTHYGLEETFSFLRLMNYISFRASVAFLTAFLLSLFFGRKIIIALYRSGFRETARDIADNSIIQDKRGTPTMGGLLIILSVVVSVLLWCNIGNIFIILSVAAVLWFGWIGYSDDRSKLRQQSSEKGLSRPRKLALQALFGLVLGIILFTPQITPYEKDIMSNLYVPFYKFPVVNLSYFYVLFGIFVIISISNAVNFADGLDGLAIVPASTTMLVYGVFAYVLGNAKYSQYLLFEYIPGTGELTVLSAAVVGAGLGFLWFNAYPANVFMGDTGSQALGGLIATVAIILKKEFLFLIAGGIFLAEAVSVLLQDRIGIARIGRRFFYRAPLHHTFQFRGIPESTVVVRFWIVSIILALVSFLTLKIR